MLSTSIVQSSAMNGMGGRRIYCSGRDLHTISSEIFAYPDVTYLELSPRREASLDFKLAELPQAIGRLTELRTLILDSNDLRTLPEEICHLRQLIVLVVSNNALASLPSELGNMTLLESLHVANNRLRDLPSSFCRLTHLIFLDLSSNKLRRLPDDIGQLTQLRSLLLFDNRLCLLPDSIRQLSALQTLWLGNNRLRTLPRALLQLKHLDWKRKYLSTILDGNPLLSPPMDVCRSGFTAMERWYQRNGSVDALDLDGPPQEHLEQSSASDETTNRFVLERSAHIEN